MAQITLLDGGMGQELIARSGDDPGTLWATRVMIDHPGLVRAIHEDYFAAGATIARRRFGIEKQEIGGCCVKSSRREIARIRQADGLYDGHAAVSANGCRSRGRFGPMKL